MPSYKANKEIFADFGLITEMHLIAIYNSKHVTLLLGPEKVRVTFFSGALLKPENIIV